MIAVVGLLGLAVAGGSIVRGSGTSATARQALPYAAMGAVAGVAIALILFVVAKTSIPDMRTPHALHILAAVFIAATLGALAGVAFTPDRVSPDDVSPLPDDVIEQRQRELGDVGDAVVARPVDFDGDGLPDRNDDGDVVLAYDEDGDGVIDGYLAPCPPSTGRITAPREGRTPVDIACDGSVDRWIELSDEPFTSSAGQPPFPRRGLPEISPRERAERADDAGPGGQRGAFLRNLLIVLAVVAAAAILIALIVRWPDRDDIDGDTPEPPTRGDDPAIVGTMERSRDAMLADPDPREGIRAAYGVLLDELARQGLRRRPEEAPHEHLRRVFTGSHLDLRWAEELATLFDRARFSTLPITEEHRMAAIDALGRAIDDARRVPAGSVTASAANPWPAPGSTGR